MNVYLMVLLAALWGQNLSGIRVKWTLRQNKSLAASASTLINASPSESEDSSFGAVPRAVLPSSAWKGAACKYREELEAILYPAGPAATKAEVKAKHHAINHNPVYNFLHRYYSFSAKRLLCFSPGAGVVLEGASAADALRPVNKGGKRTKNGAVLYPSRFLQESSCGLGMEYSAAQVSAKQRTRWTRNQSILRSTSLRKPNFACFGLHEWAMLARGDGLEFRHQRLPLRVDQQTIDRVVNAKGALRCSHYDAFRFFHPDAARTNDVKLSRATQGEHEQPGCVHATMDLFKYAYDLYPLIPAHTLLQTLEVALQARRLDMRASPYDTSDVDDVRGGPICIETATGRLQYAEEQEALFMASNPIRFEVLSYYDLVLGQGASLI